MHAYMSLPPHNCVHCGETSSASYSQILGSSSFNDQNENVKLVN